MLITLARKPLCGSVVQNALQHGCGALNVDSTRIGVEHRTYKGSGVSEQRYSDGRAGLTDGRGRCLEFSVTGRWPANVLVTPAAAATMDSQSGITQSGVAKEVKVSKVKGQFVQNATSLPGINQHADKGGASRYFKQVKGC